MEWKLQHKKAGTINFVPAIFIPHTGLGKKAFEEVWEELEDFECLKQYHIMTNDKNEYHYK
jgi:hypothetical protein